MALGLAAAPAAAEQSIVPPRAFEAMSENRTLHFTLHGRPFGAEQFFTGRRSLWRHADGVCAPGIWRPEGDAICFEYEGDPAPVCWRLLDTPEGYVASLVEGGEEAGLRLDLDRIGAEPLPCPGPRVGS